MNVLRRRRQVTERLRHEFVPAGLMPRPVAIEARDVEPVARPRQRNVEQARVLFSLLGLRRQPRSADSRYNS